VSTKTATNSRRILRQDQPRKQRPLKSTALAGGAAFLGVSALIGAFSKMNDEMEKAIENRIALDKANRSAVDKDKQFGERISESVEKGEIAVPNADRVKELERKYRNLVDSGVSGGAAFDVAIGRRSLSDDQVEFLAGRRSVGARGGDAREQLRGDLTGAGSTKTLEFIADKMNITVDEVTKLLEMQKRFNELKIVPGTEKDFNTHPISAALNTFLPGFLGNLGEPGGPLGPAETLQQKQLDELFQIIRAFRTDEEKRTSTLDQAADKLKRAAEDMQAAAKRQQGAAENLETVTDRAAQRRIRTGGGVRREGAAR
jgi:hypothetical protein